MDSRIFVAGHRGLIGSALVRMLRQRGCTNVLTRTRAELELADAAAVDRLFVHERPEHVLLAAGRVGGIVVNRDRPADFIAENLAIQLNVIGAAHRAGVRRLILFASSCMYPREAPQLWGSGKPRREFLYADDLAAACWLLLGADLAAVELPLNIGPGTDTSVRELAASVAGAVGYGGSIEWDSSTPDGAPRKLLDSSRVRRLGWRAEVALEEGVRRTHDWYRANG